MDGIPPVDAYIEAHPKWGMQLKKLRNILKKFPFEETLKWGIPVFVYQGKNLIGMAAFKNHFALWFYEGALLSRNQELLENAQEGKTKYLRQIKFDENSEIKTDVLIKYIKESVELAKSGVKVKINPSKELIIPIELSEQLKNDPDFEKAFSELSLAKQKEYSEYINEAKRRETKIRRLKKISPMIKSGKGLNDIYK